MKKITFFLLFISYLIFPEEKQEGKIQEVILYRNQALVTRVLSLNLPEGNHEVVISKLPSQIIPNSLYAEAQGAEIRAARVKTQELEKDPSPEVSSLNEKIEKVETEINRLRKMLDVNKQKKII